MTQVVLPSTITPGTPMVAAEVQNNFVELRDKVNGQLEGGSGAASNIKADGITARELADIILQRGVPTADQQEGVETWTDLAVTPSAGMVLSYATGKAWITDDTGVVAAGALLPATITGGTVTVTAAHATLPRVDQVIATLTGYNTATVSVLAGTPTAGAQATSPMAANYRLGAAAIPSNAIVLAEITVGAAVASITAANIGDRRQHTFSGKFAYNGTTESSSVIGGGAAGAAWGTMPTVDRINGIYIPQNAMVELAINGIFSVNGGAFGRIGLVVGSYPAGPYRVLGNLATNGAAGSSTFNGAAGSINPSPFGTINTTNLIGLDTSTVGVTADVIAGTHGGVISAFAATGAGAVEGPRGGMSGPQSFWLPPGAAAGYYDIILVWAVSAAANVQRAVTRMNARVWR